ncbi:MAG: hypothetical protein AB8G99_13425 [Planctomycetaceae bacterium]
MKTTVVVGTIVAVMIVIVLSGGCHSWDHDKSIKGIEYKRVRKETVGSESIRIGQLKNDVEIDGRTYTGWLHRREDDSISGGMIASDTVIDGITVPAKTWVSFDNDSRLTACHFPGNQTIQEHVCLGTGGGVKGATVKFYPGGRLRLFFSPTDVTVQGIPCKGGLFKYIGLHESGGLKRCTLSKGATIGGKDLPKGTAIELDESGKLCSTSSH